MGFFNLSFFFFIIIKKLFENLFVFKFYHLILNLQQNFNFIKVNLLLFYFFIFIIGFSFLRFLNKNRVLKLYVLFTQIKSFFLIVTTKINPLLLFLSLLFIVFCFLLIFIIFKYIITSFWLLLNNSAYSFHLFLFQFPKYKFFFPRFICTHHKIYRIILITFNGRLYRFLLNNLGFFFTNLPGIVFAFCFFYDFICNSFVFKSWYRVYFVFIFYSVFIKLYFFGIHINFLHDCTLSRALYGKEKNFKIFLKDLILELKRNFSEGSGWIQKIINKIKKTKIIK